MTKTSLPVAGLARRVGALLYDSLLLLAVLMLGTACFLPFTGGEAITFDAFPALAVLHKIAVSALTIGFYGIFWTRRGQTLGMAAWRLRVERDDGALLSWHDTVRRVAAGALSLAPLGLGWLWVVIDRDRLAWHDRLSATRVVVLPKS